MEARVKNIPFYEREGYKCAIYALLVLPRYLHSLLWNTLILQGGLVWSKKSCQWKTLSKNKGDGRISKKEKSKLDNATEWFNNNRDFAIIVIPAVITVSTILLKGGISLIKSAYRIKQANKIQQQKARTMYDYSLHRYWTLRRDLTNMEMMEIARRRKDGEKLAEILRDLKVI